MATGKAGSFAQEGRVRLCYLPLDALAAGMCLGEPIMLAEHNVVRYSLPAGHCLTEDNLRQLAAHHAEFVCISTPETRSEEEMAAQASAATTRILAIFIAANLTQPVIGDLFDRVLAYRSR